MSEQDTETVRALLRKAVDGWRGAPAVREMFTLEQFTGMTTAEIEAFDKDGTVSARMVRVYQKGQQ